ncbi:hypothetical protein B0T13DRAFT_122843 [Neurospora crassa]|nr:hypothetical protein B0T13DRAFT_122843 [Neurospora crassa]
MSSGALARCCFWLVVVFLARTLRPPLKSQEQPPVKPPGHLPWEEPHRHATMCTNSHLCHLPREESHIHAAMCTNSHLWSHFTTTVCSLPTGSVNWLSEPSSPFPGGRIGTDVTCRS